MAVCTDTGTLFMISPARTTVRLRNFSSGDAICERIITIRRLFSLPLLLSSTISSDRSVLFPQEAERPLSSASSTLSARQ